MKIRPIFLYSNHFPPFPFTGITLLFFVIVRKRNGNKVIPSERFIRHETYHVWQQLCLFTLGVISAIIGEILGASTWIWITPAVLPFAIYVLCWLIEILLPPYKSAYKDICFEGEALYNERNKNPKFYPFTFLRYIRNKDWKRLGETDFPEA